MPKFTNGILGYHTPPQPEERMSLANSNGKTLVGYFGNHVIVMILVKGFGKKKICSLEVRGLFYF